MGRTSGGIDIRQLTRRKRRGRSKDREDLDFGLCGIEGTHDSVLCTRDAVECAERVGGFLTSDLGVGIAYECVPDFDGATAFEDVDPDGTPE